MKRMYNLGLLLVLVLSLSGFTSSAPSLHVWNTSGPQTYTVLVGAEISGQGVDLQTFFPNKLHIHVGDTVDFRANSHEIHTTTFLAGQPLPSLEMPGTGGPTPLMINPAVAFMTPNDGTYDGSTYMNSGVMSLAETDLHSFSLTFTKMGSFDYVCVVHGMVMSGTIVVEKANKPVLSPDQVTALALHQIGEGFSEATGVMVKAMKAVPEPKRNSDGSTTYFVMLGYSQGSVDLMRFFPNHLNVKPGDTVQWMLPKENMAPHTVTFLNGAEDPALITPVPQPNGPPNLFFNPVVFFPANADKPLTKSEGFVNSGLLVPGQGPQTFSLKIGDEAGVLPFICILHDESGMFGSLNVMPKVVK